MDQRPCYLKTNKMTHCHGWVTEKTTDALPVEGPTVVSGPSFSDSLLSGISFTQNPCLRACKVHLRQSGLGEGALGGEELAPSRCVTKESRSLLPAQPGILKLNHRREHQHCAPPRLQGSSNAYEEGWSILTATPR